MNSPLHLAPCCAYNRQMRLPRGIGAALALGFVATSAHAESPPFDPAIDVQLYDYAIGPKTFFSVTDGDVAQRKQLAVDFFITYLTNPFTVYNVAPGEDMITGTRTQVVKSVLAGQLSGAYGITDKLQLGVMLPMVFSMQGDGVDPASAMPVAGGLRVTGLGDLLAELKYNLVRKGPWRVAAVGGLTLPSSFGSGGSQFIGDDLPSARLKLAAQWTQGRFALGTNLGLVGRKPRQIYASEVGQQAVLSAALALRVTEKFQLVAEGLGRTGLTALDLDQSPFEAGGGLRVQATESVAVVAGGGAGLVKGIGAPDLRVFFSVGYAPDLRDSDGDGVPNGRDQCKSIPEDRDGWQDRDGCPDDDNDGDRRDDTVDKCVNEAEDIDGFDDDDGCPELDNDGDGIADLDDKCAMDKEDGAEPSPKDGCPAGKRDSDGDALPDNIDACPASAEDVDGFEDEDGCPEADNDKDGVPDATDACLLCPEDKDGFEDADGCPDLDDDKDGVVDTADKCPKEPETVNGIADDDGCPDQGGINIARLDGDKLVVDRPPTFDRKGLTRAGDLIMDQVALVMVANSDVAKWLIAYAGSGDVQQQVAWMKARLALRGVAVDQIEFVAASGAARLGGVVQERVDADAPKTCPASLQVQPRAVAPKAGAPLPTTEAGNTVAPRTGSDPARAASANNAPGTSTSPGPGPGPAPIVPAAPPAPTAPAPASNAATLKPPTSTPPAPAAPAPATPTRKP